MSFSRTILVTGGTSGLGFYAAQELARQYPKSLVVIASRSDPQAAAESINSTLGQKNAMFIPLDLSSQTKIRSFVKDWERRNFPPIQALLLNAGLQLPEGVRMTEDNIEMTFGVNHVGHALLFHLLFPHLAQGARVVVTSSGTHDPAQKTPMPDAKYNTAEEIAHPTAETEKNSGRQRYSESKLANVLWTYALSKRFQRLPEKRLTVTAFDPGLMPGTGLAREAGAIAKFLWNRVLPLLIPVLRAVVSHNIHTPQESGASLAWLASSDDVKGVSGKYYEGRKSIDSSIDSYNEAKQEDLWSWTVKNIASGEETREFELV